MGISIEMFKFYEVGGKIRDELLGLTNKDVDYVAVPTEACYSSIHPRSLLYYEPSSSATAALQSAGGSSSPVRLSQEVS